MLYSPHYANGVLSSLNKRKIEDVFRSIQTPHGRSRLKLMRLRCLDCCTGHFVTGRIKSLQKIGTREVYRVSCAGGYAVDITKDSSLWTNSGWKTLEEVCGGLEFRAETGLTVRGTSTCMVAVNGFSPPSSARRDADGNVFYRNPEWLRHSIVSGKNFTEMAAEAGVSKHTIRLNVRKAGLAGLSHKIGKFRRVPWNKGKRYKFPPRGQAYRDACKARCRRGENHPMWRGGATPHPMDYELRATILKRDNFQCKMCSKRPTRRKLHIHHIDLYVPGKPSNTDPKNLITLCASCHGKVTGREAQFAVELASKIGVELLNVPAASSKKGRKLAVKFKEVENVTFTGTHPVYMLEMEASVENFVSNGFITRSK